MEKVTVEFDTELLEQAQKIFKKENLSTEQAIIAFLMAVVNQNKIPPEVECEHIMKRLNNFGDWLPEEHYGLNQYKRLLSAKSNKMVPKSVDQINLLATFSGSDNKLYTTTLNACSCGDFIHRHLPCKHIYRFAIELGILDK